MIARKQFQLISHSQRLHSQSPPSEAGDTPLAVSDLIERPSRLRAIWASLKQSRVHWPTRLLPREHIALILSSTDDQRLGKGMELVNLDCGGGGVMFLVWGSFCPVNLAHP